jgi:hypothetical protein
MTVIAVTPIFNPHNNGWIYLAVMDDGSNWVRSVKGNWGQINLPVPFDKIAADFTAWIGQNAAVPLSQIATEDNDVVVVDPKGAKAG